MTTTLSGIFKLNNKCNKNDVAKEINILAAQYGFGIQLTPGSIHHDDVKKLLLEKMSENEILFYLSYSPSDCESEEIFSVELNPTWDNPIKDNDRIFEFFRNVWSIDNIIGAVFIAWDLTVAVEELPHKKGSLDDFFDILRNWNIMALDGEGDIILEVEK